MNDHTDTLLSGLDAATKMLGQNIAQIGLPAVDQAIVNLGRIRAAVLALKADNVVELPVHETEEKTAG